MSGNQFIQMIDGEQVLVSFHGTQKRPFIHGVVIEAMGDKYLVRMNYGNGPIEGYDAPFGSYARPMSPQRTANWVSIWERDREREVHDWLEAWSDDFNSDEWLKAAGAQ